MPQSLAKVYLHAVFSTKNREPLLADEWRDELSCLLGGATNNLFGIEGGSQLNLFAGSID
jgi:hypothetical protein